MKYQTKEFGWNSNLNRLKVMLDDFNFDKVEDQLYLIVDRTKEELKTILWDKKK